MKLISAISSGEFLQAFLRCTPPPGWQGKLAVANSGGPDSTCLLYLIHRMLSDHGNQGGRLPSSTVSLTVDHQLQSESSVMAERCSKVAASLGIEHLTSPVPWGEEPFPPNPSGAGSFEKIARDARYHILFHAMRRVGARTIAFGHHVDDQLETSLMRLARGTTEIGAGGMRHIRRWGMGFGKGPSDLGWAGYAGMSRWILRPMLEFSKDRIIATCEENDLEYVTDKTNFQPEVTLRNAVRRMLAEDDAEEGGNSSILNDTTLPLDIRDNLTGIHDAAQSLRNVYLDISSGREQLRGAVKLLSSRVEDVDREVTSHLKRRTLPSPPGTFLLSSHGLSSIRDDTIRASMILRIMRYVSFHPWGSIRADGNRRKHSLEQIISKVWEPDPFAANLAPFVAGGGVMWTPVGVTNGKIQIPENVRRLKIKPQKFAWIASRQPPLSREGYFSKGVQNPLLVDVTSMLKRRLEQDDKRDMHILYDLRFLVTFNLHLIPESIAGSIVKGQGSVHVEYETRWFLPKILWRFQDRSTPTETLVRVSGDVGVAGERAREVGSSWNDIKWIRTLDAI